MCSLDFDLLVFFSKIYSKTRSHSYKKIRRSNESPIRCVSCHHYSNNIQLRLFPSRLCVFCIYNIFTLLFLNRILINVSLSRFCHQNRNKHRLPANVRKTHYVKNSVLFMRRRQSPHKRCYQTLTALEYSLLVRHATLFMTITYLFWIHVVIRSMACFHFLLNFSNHLFLTAKPVPFIYPFSPIF